MDPLVSSIIAGVSVNLVTALIIWFLIDKRSKRNDELKNKLNNKRLVKSALISQFASVINTNIEMQYLAFKVANIRFRKTDNIDFVLHTIMNDLRHIANSQHGLYRLLIDLGADKDIIQPFATLSNEIAVIAILLHRNNGCSESDFVTYSNWYNKVEQSPVIEWENHTHWKRIEILLTDLKIFCINYNQLTEEKKLEIYINLGEAMGHLTRLYTDGILLSFNKEVLKLE